MHATRWLSISAAAALVWGCESHSTPSGTNFRGLFLGYRDPTTKQTVCGDCHVLHQQGWVQTAHSWTATGPAAFQRANNPNGVGNQDSAGFSTDCAWCHTTNGRNSGLAKDTSGWWAASAPHKAYFTDVQCEACHGPGAAHSTTPDNYSAQPVGAITSDTGLPRGCNVCHNEADNPYGAQWRTGAHGKIIAAAASQPECAGCHEGKAVVLRFDPSARFVEQSSSTLYPITCVGCHDPHATGGAWVADTPAYDRVWLRAPVTVADVNVNLCMQCHQRDAAPTQANLAYGPHSPQGPMLLGTAGWLPPGFATAGPATHGMVARNTKLCVTCHMPAWDFISPKGEPFHTPGHRFWAIPCVKPDGAGGVTPDTTNTCAIASRNFGACAVSGCHVSTGNAQLAFQSVGTTVQGYLNDLWVDVNGDGKIDAGDTGLLTQVPPGEFQVTSAITVAEGALFNFQLVQADGSQGVHNAFYTEQLLIATIHAVSGTYGLPLPPGVPDRVRPRRPLRVAASGTY